MKLAITGALGHIGSRLIRELPKHLAVSEIVMIDNLATQRYASLMHLPSGPRYRFVEGDVTDMSLVPLFGDAGAVVHLAALTDATASFDHPEDMERVNVAATRRVAEACAEAGVAMIHASSTSVYGTSRDSVDESCPPEDISPQSPYADAKWSEELLVRDLCDEEGLRAMSFRFGTIFGVSPGMRFHTAVNRFCWQAVMGEPLSVWRTAYDQKRPYLDLCDAVRAIAFVIEKALFHGQVYNAVTVNTTVRQVVEEIRLRLEGVEVGLVDSPRMNSLSYDVLNSRLTGAGFQFRGDLGKAIGETIDALRNANGR